MNASFNVSQLNVRRIYTPDAVELKLIDINNRVVFIVDRENVGDSPITTLFEQAPNRKLEYRGFPYTEQITNALSDPQSNGLVVVVKEPVESFQERHFREHGDMYQTLSRKYKKPIILHMVSQGGRCEFFEEYAAVVLQRQEVFGQLQVECIKNQLEERIRPS